jgi:DNA uptake protein ComE-like DNA-binding protein
MWNEIVKDYFNFTKKERSGIIWLILIVIFISLGSFFNSHFTKKSSFDSAEFKYEIALLKEDSSSGNRHKSFDNEYNNDHSLPDKDRTEIKTETFFFDPNTISEAEWIRLGIRGKTAKTILKYVSKGGKFYKPKDLQKIWGLRKSDVERLLPYVRIKKAEKKYEEYPKREYDRNSFTTFKSISKVEINDADTSAFIALPGIGSKLSQRIIAFREKLGGFYSVDQVGETYFLADSTFQRIKPYLFLKNNSVHRININTAGVDEMKAHPYIKYNLANAIVEYRKQHGNYQSVEAIKKIMMVTDEIYKKAAPYLSIE